MTDTAAAPSSKTPTRIIRDALRWASILGLRVVPSAENNGVIRFLYEEEKRAGKRWIREGRYADISIVGAVLLMEQPHAVDHEFAASEALGVGVPWVLGLEAACAGLAADPSDVANAIPEYLAGWEAGREIRQQLIPGVADVRP